LGITLLTSIFYGVVKRKQFLKNKNKIKKKGEETDEKTIKTA
jgi:hypothetical protein